MKYGQTLSNLHKSGIDKNSTPQEIAAAGVGTTVDKNGRPNISSASQGQNYGKALKNYGLTTCTDTVKSVDVKASPDIKDKSLDDVKLSNNGSLSIALTGNYSEGFENYLRGLEKTYGTQYVFENVFKGDKNKYDPYKRASQITGIPLRGDATVECGLDGKKAFEAALYGKGSNVNNTSVKNKYENDIRYKKLSDRVNSWDNIESYKKEFVMEVFPIILKYEYETGVPAEIIFGQMCSESSYGTETLTDKYTGKEANNYFGVKGNGPAGSVKCDTTEFVNGKRVHIVDEFRAYNNMDEAIKDYANLLNRNYKKYITTGTPEDWANALVEGGYATAPNYGEAILDVSKTWGIYE